MSSQEKQETLEIVARSLEIEAETLRISSSLDNSKLADSLDRIAANVRTRISPT
jgi:hypothetical protein